LTPPKLSERLSIRKVTLLLVSTYRDLLCAMLIFLNGNLDGFVKSRQHRHSGLPVRRTQTGGSRSL
jgi:hypothetical protein